MAYSEDITVSTMQDVIDEITSFAVTNAGFTLYETITDDLPAECTTTMIVLSKNSMYWYFVGTSEYNSTFGANMGFVRSRMGKDIWTASNMESTSVNAQYIHSRMSTFGNDTGSFTGLNLYTDGDTVSAALEVYSGVYTHTSFGIVTKFGTWTGGEYNMSTNFSYYYSTTSEFIFNTSSQNQTIFDGTWGSNYSNLTYGANFIYRTTEIASDTYEDFPRIGNNSGYATLGGHYAWCGTGVKPSVYDGSAVSSSWFGHEMWKCSPSTYTTRAMLQPIYFFFSSYADVTEYHCQGQVTLAATLNINRLEAKDVVDTDWVVYPICAKTGDTSSYPVSTDWGIAYKRI
jgi:hypothetical protein